MRAIVEDEKLKVIHGDEKFNNLPITLKGIYAIDMQSNCVGLYWDEESDLRATQLDDIKTYLQSLAEF